MTTPVLELQYRASDLASGEVLRERGVTFQAVGLAGALLEKIAKSKVRESAGILSITAHTDGRSMPAWYFTPDILERLSALRMGLELVVLSDLHSEDE